MADAWIIRYDDETETLYLLEADPIETWVKYPRDAATFTSARARSIVRRLGEGRSIAPVRRFEEIRRAFVERGVPQ